MKTVSHDDFKRELNAAPVIAILRGVTPETILPVCEVLAAGGVRFIEVTMNSPEALASIRKATDRFAGAGVRIGAGTVTKPSEVEQVAEAGGAYIISPNTNPAIIRRAKELGLISIPGFMTPSEAFEAIDAGADLLKCFPVCQFGPEYLKQLRAVLSTPVIAVGGITVDNAGDYMKAGASGIGVGASLYTPTASLDNISKNASLFMARALRKQQETSRQTASQPANLRRTWQGIPGLERTAKGRLFITWFSGGKMEPAAENTVFLCHSDDQGKTFAVPLPMAGPHEGARAFDPTLWTAPDGRLWLIFNRGDKEHARHGVYARICANPDAQTLQWTAEFRIGYDAAPLSFRMNKPTVLASGEWIMPVTHAAEPIYDWFAGPKQLQGVGISTDQGKTWTLHGALKAPNWALENMIVELRGGRLWMLIRTGSGVLWESHSTDKGRTWSEAKPSTIANPGSRFFIRRLSSGNLLLVNHHKFTGRSHLTARLSTDDGSTWNDGLLLDERANVSYPDGAQDRDGLIWIVYDRERHGAGEILLATFREDDVAIGRDVSGSVSLKQVINHLDAPLA